MDDKELLLKVSFMVEQQTLEINKISRKVDGIQDKHITDTNSNIAVLKEKVGRLEKVVYGTVAIIITQLIAIVFLWLKN